MLTSKFDLYKNEWLDLVFDDRNKAYGAYDLRHNYANNMVKAMLITFFSIGVLCAVSIYASSRKEIVHITPVDLRPNVMPPVEPIKKIEPPKAPEHIKPQPVKTIATIRDVPPVVVVDVKAQDPVKNDDIKGAAIGQQTLKGTTGVNIDIPEDKPGTGGDGPAVDNSVHNLGTLDFMPEPVGGAAAWAKFLNKNLRFPAVAQEDGVSGRVLLSFIIEKDGSLSNIVVDKPAGHGFDEEALRVLKLAKAWKPGMQNGQAVRVKYSIPINFQLADQ
ncbi:energy transducer TonB [Mucilaginibacter sp.]|uniref:energy transducer TonB n=1 Tax=Mucilaginibacter sp. TaxID=1882438 RepID=UPI0025D7939A|nr:energy transducer TonB [Mucilaginibacter sp.]